MNNIDLISSIKHDFDEEIRCISFVADEKNDVELRKYIISFFEKDVSWCIVSVSSGEGMKKSIANQLTEIPKLRAAISVEERRRIKSNDGTDSFYSIAIEKMLTTTKAMNKKILIVLDDVKFSQEVLWLVSLFQMEIREDVPLYMIITGMEKNIDSIRMNETTAFLSRVSFERAE